MTDADAPALARLPEDWERALAVVAHPDDMEYGAASAVSRWTSQGKDVRYVLVTDGEAGIATMPPRTGGPVAACRAEGQLR
jgi:LmbE family N-acetylglucosaminyl deacetylase